MIYIRNVLGELFTLPQIAISHVVDNSASPPLTENLGVAKKSEHFRRWLHFMRHCVLHGYTYVHLCKTHEMLANALTKVREQTRLPALREGVLTHPRVISSLTVHHRHVPDPRHAAYLERQHAPRCNHASTWGC